MLKTPYLLRLAAGSAGAVIMTLAITLLVMWMNGLIADDKPSQVALTPCVFGEKESAPPQNPFAADPIVVDCIPPEEAKPLFTQWFDRILSRRDPDEASRPAAGG